MPFGCPSVLTVWRSNDCFTRVRYRKLFGRAGWKYSAYVTSLGSWACSSDIDSPYRIGPVRVPILWTETIFSFGRAGATRPSTAR